MPAPPGLRIFMPFRSAVALSGFLVAVPVLEAEIDPRPQHLRAQLGLELGVDDARPRLPSVALCVTSIGWP